MNEAWSQWEGHLVGGKFQLKNYLGGSDQSAVFLTEELGREPEPVAIKLIAATPASAELQLARWGAAQRLSHPHLIQLQHIGSCRAGSRELIFAVMEYAEENLAQILPQRALTAPEAREMLVPMLQALAFLHGQGYVHGHLKPANVTAIRDQLKLASDGICRTGDKVSDSEKPGAYDAPEMAGGVRSPAADVWSLGMTLAEALTQRLPPWSAKVPADPVVPESLPAPFLEIVRGCLRRDPHRRLTVREITALLGLPLPAELPKPPAHAGEMELVSQHRAAVASSAAQSLPQQHPTVPASTAAQPLPQHQPAVAASPATQSLPQNRPAAAPSTATQSVPQQRPVAPASARMQPLPQQRPAAAASSGSHAESAAHRFAFPGAVAVLLLAALIALLGLLRRQPENRPHASAKKAQPSLPSQEAQRPSPKTAPKPSPKTASITRSGEQSAAGVASLHAAPASEMKPSPAVLRSAAPAGAPSNGGPQESAVVQQVLPNVPQSASDTIHGTVRVSVRINVGPSGSVEGVELDSPGPSRYFARLALQSAQGWKFAPSTEETAREFILHFEFRNSGPRAFATRAGS